MHAHDNFTEYFGWWKTRDMRSFASMYFVLTTDQLHEIASSPGSTGNLNLGTRPVSDIKCCSVYPAYTKQDHVAMPLEFHVHFPETAESAT